MMLLRLIHDWSCGGFSTERMQYNELFWYGQFYLDLLPTQNSISTEEQTDNKLHIIIHAKYAQLAETLFIIHSEKKGARVANERNTI